MIIPVGYAQVTHFFGGSALPNGAAVTYGVVADPALGPLGYAQELHDAWGDNFQPRVSGDVALLSTLVKMGPNATGAAAIYAETRTGGVEAQPVPPNTAVLIRKAAILGGRKNRGRFYVPGAIESQVNQAGDLGSTYRGEWQASADAFLARLDAFGADLVILHSASSDPTTVTALTVDGRVATQRRRLRK